MKRHSRWFLCAVLLTAALLLWGCWGGGTKKEQTAEEFLAQMETALSSLDANKIADLFAFPILLDPVLPGQDELKFERQHFVRMIQGALTAAKEGGAVFEVKFVEPKYQEKSDSAVVETQVYMKVKIDEDTAHNVFVAFVNDLFDVFMELYEEVLKEILKEFFDEIPDDFTEIAEQLWDALMAGEPEEWPVEEEITEEVFFELTKVNGKWKLSSEVDVELPLTALFRR
ncbi:hypothetical protein [Candidatus Darwinibacter acetoxidans]